jgi:hypothetical protein
MKMTPDSITAAKAQAELFLEAVSALEHRKAVKQPLILLDVSEYFTPPAKIMGAIRRSSMNLTRALSELRK